MKGPRSHPRTAILLFLLGLSSQIIRFWVLFPLMFWLYRTHYDLAVRLKWIDGLLNALCSSPFYIGLLAGFISKERRTALKLILWAWAGYMAFPLLFSIVGVGDTPPEGYYPTKMLYGIAMQVIIYGGLCLFGGGIGLGIGTFVTEIIAQLKERKRSVRV